MYNSDWCLNVCNITEQIWIEGGCVIISSPLTGVGLHRWIFDDASEVVFSIFFFTYKKLFLFWHVKNLCVSSLGKNSSVRHCNDWRRTCIQVVLDYLTLIKSKWVIFEAISECFWLKNSSSISYLFNMYLYFTSVSILMYGNA